MFQHCRENQGIPRLGALGSLLVYNSCPAVPCTSSGNISMAFLGLGIINFECLTLLWSGKVFSRKAAGHSELCWAPESLLPRKFNPDFFSVWEHFVLSVGVAELCWWFLVQGVLWSSALGFIFIQASEVALWEKKKNKPKSTVQIFCVPHYPVPKIFNII